MPETRSLTFTRTIQAAPAEVLRGFTHPTLLRDWLCDAASAEARPGGHLFLTWRQGYQVMGRCTLLDLPGRLAFTWLGAGDPGQTQVTVTAEPRGEGQTLLTLAHSGLGEGPAWEILAARWRQEWPAALENLQSLLETGIDLRQARRPRLGIWYGELTERAAQRLGLPAPEGVLIEGTGEGSGAREAGLQKDDVLVSLNGVPLRGPDSFGEALFGLNAGDSPLVEFIRGGQKHSAALRLGVLPTPEYPATAAALAGQARGLYRDELAALRAQLNGLSEERAARSPAPGEWSVREIVAHLVLTERDYHAWVADMLNDLPVEDDLRMSPNVTPRIQSLVRRIPTLAGLLEALEAVLEETAAMLAALPESFLQQRKHLYRRAAGWAIEATPGHYAEEHRDQIQAAIDASA